MDIAGRGGAPGADAGSLDVGGGARDTRPVGTDPDPGTGGTPQIDARPPMGMGGAGGTEPPMTAMDARPPEASPPEEPPPSPPDAMVAPDLGVEPAPPDAMPPSELANGLVGYWPLEEGMGMMAADRLGQNHGTLAGGAMWIKPGFADPTSKAALRLDGNDDYVELGTRNMPANNKPQSVSFWFRYTTAPSGDDAGVVVSLTNGNASGARLKLGLRNQMLTAWKSNGNVLVNTALPTPNAWHHFVYVFDGMSNHLYVDGTERAKTTTAPDNAPATNVRIGAIYNNAENFLGDVDEVRIYGRAITPAEVMALAKGQQ